MILTSIISGRAARGGARKPIVHPYDGTTPDAIEYAQAVRIPPFEPVSDMRAYRTHLTAACKAYARHLKVREERIVRIAAQETGSPVRYHREDAEGARQFLQELPRAVRLLPAGYRYEPKGNVLIILSANEPIIEATILACSALLMGNAVFVKPSSKTPSYARLLVAELGRHPALKKRIHYLLADAAETERLIRERSFDLVLSLGSRSTNRALGALCAEAETEFVPESEGSDWAYVDKSCASVAKVAEVLVQASMKHNGQMCNALRGVLAHAPVYDALVVALDKQVKALTLGSPLSPDSQVGALIAGTEERARAVLAESAPGAAFPALVLDPEPSSPIVTESIFAPALWVRKVKDHREALRFYAERNRHGLGFSVFAKDKAVAQECIASAKAGRVNVNKDPLAIGLFDPLGGVKLSGHGGPRLWIEKFSDRKLVSGS